MIFVSRRKEFRLIIRPTEVIIDESRRPHVMRGERVEFKQGKFMTEDKGLIDYLLHHPLYGLQYTSELGSDPVAITKHSLVFDDGAELSGPKIVAGFPEKNIVMNRGATSTQNSGRQPLAQEAPKEFARKEVAKILETPSISKDEVEALIDSKLDSFLDKIGSLVIQPKITKAKREFHCPICQEPFSSNIAVGKHKKENHPEGLA